MNAAVPKRTKIAKPRLSSFARRLFAAWKQLNLPLANATVILAVSGGADSTALFLGLDELLKTGKLSLLPVIAHLDHGLRQASRGDGAWVRTLAEELGYRAVVRRIDVKRRAASTGDNLEQAARRARYNFLKSTARKVNANLILTAHTLDDQAETVLLRLLRGSAAEGLSGIEGVRPLEAGSQIQLARPLISWARRSNTEEYCRARDVSFRVDEMNLDDKFARVKVRQQLLPLMQSFNNKIVDALARTASLLREDADALTVEAGKLLAGARKPASADVPSSVSLNVTALAKAPAAVRRRALRLWLEQERGHLRRVEMVHLVAIDRLLAGERGERTAQLPDGGSVTRSRGWLQLNGFSPRKKG